MTYWLLHLNLFFETFVMNIHINDGILHSACGIFFFVVLFIKSK